MIDLLEQCARPLAAAFQSVLDWVYPTHCYACGVAVEDRPDHMLCPGCFDLLRATRIAGPVCATCGLPLAGGPAPGTRCTTCVAERRYFDTARAFVTYSGPAAEIIKGFKFNGDFYAGPRLLKAMMSLGWLPEAVGGADAVLPVPLYPRRRRERGYDQALLLARAVARRLGLPLMKNALRRTRYTLQQTRLSLRERWDNVRGAFDVADPAAVRGLNLLLVDDVMTTGATTSECARTLRRAGADAVRVLTLARTAP